MKRFFSRIVALFTVQRNFVAVFVLVVEVNVYLYITKFLLATFP